VRSVLGRTRPKCYHVLRSSIAAGLVFISQTRVFHLGAACSFIFPPLRLDHAVPGWSVSRSPSRAGLPASREQPRGRDLISAFWFRHEQASDSRFRLEFSLGLGVEDAGHPEPVVLHFIVPSQSGPCVKT
jgi:hypothetical protein